MEASGRTFEISACLGRGGFGEVYRARMTRTGGLPVDVALKVLRRDVDADGQAVQRLRDEGRLLSRLNHPAILKVHDLVVLAGRISLVTEYVDGDDLSSCLGPPEPIGTRALLQVIARVASALDAAWTSKPAGGDGPLRMVHRDIKPSNIRLSRHGDVKLLDFGIARTDSVEREARTRTDMMVGSPAYMAPERFLEKAILLESDVFSLGAVLYEGLGPERFYGDLPVPMQVGLAVDDERYADFLVERLAKLDVDDDLRELLTGALAYEPSERPSPAALSRACDALADHMEGPTVARYCRGRRWSEVAPVAGELDGQTLSEGGADRPKPRALAPVEPVVPALPVVSVAAEPTLDLARPEEPRERGAFWGWALVGVGGAGLLGTAVVFVLSVLGVLTLPFLAPWDATVTPDSPPSPVGSDPTEASVPDSPPSPVGSDPTEASVPDSPPSPVGSDPTEATPPDPAPVRPPPRPTPRPTEPVAQPVAVAPKPPPEPTGPPPGHVQMEGEVVAVAVGAGGTHVLPADLPPGTYQLKAKYNGRDAVDAGQLVVQSGKTIVVSCSSRMTRCTLR
ncbi:MAG: protein kinase [Alphaproteobacteria bacterium]|nr:protein kinase [Alphaproteobacteria bacterium]